MGSAMRREHAVISPETGLGGRGGRGEVGSKLLPAGQAAAESEAWGVGVVVEAMLVAQLCPTPCDPMDWSPPGSSVQRILQARILEWGAVPFSTGSYQTRDGTRVSCIAGRWFTV